MYCPNCGKELNDATQFCPECGRPIMETPPQSSPKNTPVAHAAPTSTQPKSGSKHVVGWVFSILIVVVGFFTIFSAGFPAIFFIAAGVILNPKIRQLLHMKTWLSIVLCLTSLTIFGIVYSASRNSDTTATTNTPVSATLATDDTAEISADEMVETPVTDTPAAEDSDDGIIDIDISGCNVKYIRHEIVENMAGDKCIAVYYEFTNNSDRERSFLFTVTDKAFQDGIELESSLFHVSDESHDSSAEIKPGITITVCSGFVLRDEETDVELEVEEWINLKDHPADEMILPIK